MGLITRNGVRAPLAAFLAAAVGMLAAGCGSSDDGSSTGSTATAGASAPLTKVRTGFVPATPTLPVVIGIDQGIFKKNGLDVEYTKTVGATNAAIGRQFDIAQSTPPDFLASVEGGLDDVLVSNMMVEGDDGKTQLLASKESGVTSLKDLEGKTLGVPSRASGIAQSILYLMREDGVDTDKVKMVEIPFPNMPDQLKAGRVDAVGTLAPFTTQILANGDVTSLGDPLALAYQKACKCSDTGGGLFATSTREYAEKNPQVVEAWRKSIAEAGEFMKTHPKETTAALAKLVGIPEEIAAKTPLYETDASAVTPEEISNWITVLRGGDLLKDPAALKPEDLVAGNG